MSDCEAVWEVSKSKGFLADGPGVGLAFYILSTLSQVPKLFGTHFPGQ